MRTSTSLRWIVVAVSAAMLLAVAAACGTERVEVPGETVVVEKVVTETVEVPGETVVVKEEVVKTVEVPGQTVVVEKEVVKEVAPERYANNVWGQLVEKPQYGGSIPIALVENIVDFDPWHIAGNIVPMKLTLENLGHMDWSLSPDEFDWSKSGYTTLDTVSGALAESWEQPDPLTTIFHIRKGVNWHNKAPMNGRELDAYDVEFTFQRNFGLGEFARSGARPWFCLFGECIGRIR